MPNDSSESKIALVLQKLLLFFADALPQTIKDFGYFAVIKGIGAAARKHYNIYRRKFLKSQAKAFADQAFDAITTDCEFDLFFCDNQPQAGMLIIIGFSKNKQRGMGYANRGLIKHILKLSLVQQALRLAEHIRLNFWRDTHPGFTNLHSEAEPSLMQKEPYDLQRDDEPILYGRSWLPCEHGNRECAYVLSYQVGMYVSYQSSLSEVRPGAQPGISLAL